MIKLPEDFKDLLWTVEVIDEDLVHSENLLNLEPLDEFLGVKLTTVGHLAADGQAARHTFRVVDGDVVPRVAGATGRRESGVVDTVSRLGHGTSGNRRTWRGGG